MESGAPPWKKSDARDGTFEPAHTDTPEPHRPRRKKILESIPSMVDLYGHDTQTASLAGAAIAIQLGASILVGWYFSSCPWKFLACAYFAGGSLQHFLGVIIHECAHDLVFENSTSANRALALVCNIPLFFPFAMSFRRYHLMHHAHQGIPGKDPDLPCPFEARLVGNSSILKVAWLFMFPVWYIARSMALKKNPSKYEVVNFVFQGLAMWAWWHIAGGWALFYLALSSWFGLGLHPMAGNFVQEHYVTRDGQETYSYYGPLNAFQLNVGYHNEHHDFPKVPWSKLPLVKQKAHEYYDSIASYDSWIGVLWNFVRDPSMGPQCRVVRVK